MDKILTKAGHWIAILLSLAALGFGSAVLAAGDQVAPGTSAVPGVQVNQPPPAPRVMILTGRIAAVDKNFLGFPKEVAIDVPSIGSFLIDDAGKGKELRDHVGDIVTLMATRKTRHDGRTVLAVENYEVHPS